MCKPIIYTVSFILKSLSFIALEYKVYLQKNFCQDFIKIFFLTLIKEEQSQRPDTTQIQDLHKMTVLETLWYWQKNRQVNQWIIIERPEIDPHK